MVELHRIRQQVQEDLREPLSVRKDVVVGAVLTISDDMYGTLRRERSNEVRAFAENFVHEHGLGRELEIAGLDAGYVEHLVDESKEVLAAFEDLMNRFVLIMIELAQPQDLRETQHRVEGRP